MKLDQSIFVIALICCIALMTFGVMSFFMAAKASTIIEGATHVFADVLLAAVGAKAGLAYPGNGNGNGGNQQPPLPPSPPSSK